MYVVSGSRQRMIMLIEEDRRLGISPNITHGDLAPDKMSSTKLKRVSVTERERHRDILGEISPKGFSPK